MRSSYKISAILILNFPWIVFSQDCFKQDSILLEIIALKNIDTWAKKDGYYNFYNESNRIKFDFHPETDFFVSNTFKKWSCFKKSDYDTIIKHKDDSSFIKRTYVIPKTLIVDLIEQIQIDKCCDFEYNDDIIYTDSNYCRLTHKDFEIDKKWLKQNINRREILKRAKEHDQKWEFGIQYSMREERLKAFKGYSNTDSLDIFLSGFQKPIGLMFVSHVSERLWIDLVCDGDTLISLFKIISPLKCQSAWIDNITNREIYNPKINLIFYEMLPKSFLYKDLIKREFIKESYIDWILNRWD
jgi:hypothetical protein